MAAPFEGIFSMSTTYPTTYSDNEGSQEHSQSRQIGQVDRACAVGVGNYSLVKTERTTETERDLTVKKETPELEVDSVNTESIACTNAIQSALAGKQETPEMEADNGRAESKECTTETESVLTWKQEAPELEVDSVESTDCTTGAESPLTGKQEAPELEVDSVESTECTAGAESALTGKQEAPELEVDSVESTDCTTGAESALTGKQEVPELEMDSVETESTECTTGTESALTGKQELPELEVARVKTELSEESYGIGTVSLPMKCEPEGAVVSLHREEIVHRMCTGAVQKQETSHEDWRKDASRDLTANSSFSGRARRHRSRHQTGKSDDEDGVQSRVSVDVTYVSSGKVTHGTNKRKFCCDRCSAGFTSKHALHGHILREHPGDEETIIGFQCPDCSKRFATQDNLRRHVVIHSPARPYKCMKCPGAYKRKEDLRKHMETHVPTRKRRFPCQHCDAVFTQSCNRTRHLRNVHAQLPGNKTAVPGNTYGYECNVCGKECGSKAIFIRHMKIHSGEKEYRCCVCSNTFREHAHLKRHMKVHNCSICGEVFKSLKLRNRHKKSAHSVPNAQSCEALCQICEKEFKNLRGLNLHMARCHCHK